MSRMIQNVQMALGQIDISEIKISLKSRDDIPTILRGLQYIYSTENIKEKVFQLLESRIAPNIDKNTGRPGMELWKIFVMGVLRLDLNCDYDRLHELVNQHRTIREILGHAHGFDDYEYGLQTIRDNVRLLTSELLADINKVVVDAGHDLVSKNKNAELSGRCDSFVFETDIHYPTDINLLYDAVRKVIESIASLAEKHGMSCWRQSKYNIRHIKSLMRSAQGKKRISAKSEDQKEKIKKDMIDAHQVYVDIAQKYLNKAQNTVKLLEISQNLSLTDAAVIKSISDFTAHADRQMSQIVRRVVMGESIPHNEKVFSVFEPHTEWVSKGKVGVPVEFGIRVCILEDQHQFILHHRIMQNETDDKVAVPMIQDARKLFPNLNRCSFDKGFHSKENQEALSQELDVVALPRKGKLSQKAKTIESSKEFVKAHKNHSAVESAINALEIHGLDKCLDSGIDGYTRYVSLAIVTRNIHRIGDILKQKELKKIARRKARDSNKYYLDKAA